jgi:hypothetical protein
MGVVQQLCHSLRHGSWCLLNSDQIIWARRASALELEPSGWQTGDMSADGMDLADPQWPRLFGGYRVLYDPRSALRALELGEDSSAAWQELWNELHHQGDVGHASYAAVPHLVRIHAAHGVPDWNMYALVATIDNARRNGRNPDLPPYLRESYEAAWRRLSELGLRELATAEDPTLVLSIIAVLAIAKGQLTLGRLAIEFTEDERREILALHG